MPIVLAMELDEALATLPWTYRTALQLHLAGGGEAAIAAELGLEIEAARSLLKLAHAKLATLLTEGTGT